MLPTTDAAPPNRVGITVGIQTRLDDVRRLNAAACRTFNSSDRRKWTAAPKHVLGSGGVQSIPNGGVRSQADLKRIRGGPQVDPKRIPSGSQVDPKGCWSLKLPADPK
eukprot:CAMPEP_0181248842 /NCGR_PEP_ID=MMETSP1096-20121128/45403_1 /TAXON_ID=156174 ORGANISM="Chrysochromulina ericina, Strain CCMP281" /NCGR_SAMPLE_ID=MMETSP1096 /ASSEMBLY_ACC=CAM_ASM_000453 /LENGTH=107 /DNA_ID=CAMNT_0023346073 /DNA_START=296 /DNA_END=620 /DNA_ORIENTATION=+